MKTVVVGAGPIGLFLAGALARRGNQVVLVDRDAGPGQGQTEKWDRKGVMQFHHPHFFRPQIRDAFRAELPEVDERLVRGGAELTPINPMMPDLMGYRVRRPALEQALRSVVTTDPGVTFLHGHADKVEIAAGRARGVVVDGALIEADLVLDVSGRNSRLVDGLRPEPLGGDCGFTYCTRHYQLLPGAEPGPTNGPPGWGGIYDGYMVIVFKQDLGTFQTLIIRRSDDKELAQLREEAAFEAAARAIPGIAAWIDPEQAIPMSAPQPGAGLNNNYRGQFDRDGELIADGLVFVGDSVLTTNPAAGRGVTTGIMQARKLLELLGNHGTDFASATLEFDQWCTENMKPWFDDHVAWDEGILSRWRGEPIDYSKPLPSDLICSLAEEDPSVMPIVGPYFGMFAGPSILRQLEDRARQRLQEGFRPKQQPGPSRDELAEIVAGALAPV